MEITKTVAGYKGKYTKDSQTVEQREFTLKLITKPNLLLAIEDNKSKVITILPMEEVMSLIDILNKRIEEAENAAGKLEKAD